MQTMIPLSSIRPGQNPRRYFDQAKHEEMVASIGKRGILQPMLVREVPDEAGKFMIVAGGRRHRAAIEALGPDAKVPVIVREMTDQEALEAAIDENDIRDDASETEQADAAVRVLAACNEDRAEAAARLGWSTAKLDRRLALAGLSEAVKTALDERRIKVGHAELLAAVPADKQDKALETILGNGLDVAKTRQALMSMTMSLATATFDKTECTSCPFNSACQTVLFETHVDDGACTNAGCFQLKTEAADAARAEDQRLAAVKAAAEQPQVVEQQEAAETETPPASVEPAKPAGKTSAPPKVVVTAKMLIGRTADYREAAWRTALARSLAESPDSARATVLVAALSGSLSQIKGSTLTARAGALVDKDFPSLSYADKIGVILGLADDRIVTGLSAIAAAYAKDVTTFAHVADLARVFSIDLRDSWTVDKTFLARFTKDELKFIAQECGLVAHMGEKAFAKLLKAKNEDLVAGMLNATGFEWAGRLPSAMTLDGQYGPPPAAAD